jgi:hypothetical protein
VSTTLAKLVAKFAAGVVDTGGKFAAAGVRGKLIHKKPEAKNLVTLSL